LNSEKEEIDELYNIVIICLSKLYQDDKLLVYRSGMEQAVMFRFALYLNEIIKDINWFKKYNLTLDLEYNKNLVDLKRLPNLNKGVRPDLIIHRRQSNDYNKLIIEFKGWWSKVSNDKDIIKLKQFTCQEGEYKYDLGLFVDLQIDFILIKSFTNSTLSRCHKLKIEK